MFAPVLLDDEEDELRVEEEVVRVEFVEEMMGVVIIKINNVLLLLSLGVAAFIQFCTLEPRYLNALMWGQTSPEEDGDLSHSISNTWTEEEALLPLEEDIRIISSSQFLRALQSITAILLLSFLRVVIFPNLYRNHNATTSTFEAILADMLFHIQCRLGIGLLACVTAALPFEAIETTVVCLSVALQIASMTDVQ